MAKSDRGRVMLPTPQLDDDGDETGITAHAMDRYRERADDPDLAAVRRAWVVGARLEPATLAIQAEGVRYDPLTDLILVRRQGAVTTVMTPDKWQRAVLEELGWSE